ncbi:MAG: DNA-processing protein DprA [Bacillota bacterium]|nr:DNA-processing protein DprA [Bacillota bacterium]
MDNKFIFALENISGIGFATITKILKIANNFDDFLNKKEEILKIKRVSLALFDKIYLQKNSKYFEKYNMSIKKMEIDLINTSDNIFPNKLKEISEVPYSLHLRGDNQLLKNKIVGIVGSRKSTKYGNEVAYKMAKLLSNRGYTVISGMASGIDTYAHVGALEGEGSTIAVIGSGLDYIYPKKNTKLFFDIVNNGLVISEFFLGVKPTSYNFPRRNRIISGMADFIIVVEASFKSGSLITVNYAISQGKDVLVVPGEIFSETSEGTNLLIRDGAYPLISLDDLSEYLDNLSY